MSKTVTIFKHTRSDTPCYLGRVLDENDFEICTVTTSREDLSSFDALEPDLLMVMGGSVGVYQANYYPFLTQEIEILKKRIAQDKPTFGICLGAQLIAAALGANVYKGKQGREAGWHPLSLHAPGKNHPARHLCSPHTSMFHWHGDTFDMPDGATLLASSEKYPHQIFSYGKNTLALQCHTEVRDEALQEWYVALVDDITGPNPLIHINDLRAQTAQHVETLNVQTRKFFSEWLGQVGLL